MPFVDHVTVVLKLQLIGFRAALGALEGTKYSEEFSLYQRDWLEQQGLTTYLSQDCGEAGELGTFYVEDFLRGVPSHNQIENSAKKATISMSLILGAHAHWEGYVVEYLKGDCVII